MRTARKGEEEDDPSFVAARPSPSLAPTLWSASFLPRDLFWPSLFVLIRRWDLVFLAGVTCLSIVLQVLDIDLTRGKLAGVVHFLESKVIEFDGPVRASSRGEAEISASVILKL